MSGQEREALQAFLAVKHIREDNSALPTADIAELENSAERLAVAALSILPEKQEPPNESWCVGCGPDNCCGCPPPASRLESRRGVV